MELDDDIYARMAEIDWFRDCGRDGLDDLPFPARQGRSAKEAIASALQAAWQDARTEAQGDLTAYLAKHHDSEYDDWNRLGSLSRRRILDRIMPNVTAALRDIHATPLVDSVLLDLNRIALHSTYSRRFTRIPDFFSRLFLVYQRGRLPCGWEGDIGEWPKGHLLVY